MSDDAHEEALGTALGLNARVVPLLQSRLQALLAAKESGAGAPASVRAPAAPLQQLLLGTEQFAGAAHSTWLQREAARVQRHIALQQQMPAFQAVLLVEGVAVKGLRAVLRRRGKVSRLLCCAAPQAAVQLDGLFLKIWAVGTAAGAAAKQCGPRCCHPLSPAICVPQTLLLV